MAQKPTPPLPPEVLAAFERRQPIEAIKLLLQLRTGIARPGAAASMSRPPASPRPSAPALPKPPSAESHARGEGLSPGEMPRTESAFWAWVVVGLVVYLAYRLMR